MDLNLNGKTALVCGSTDGIGNAIVKKLAEMGAHVILMARNEEKLKKCLSDLSKSREQNHSYVVADFSDVENVKRAIDSISKPVNILINNTGGPSGGPI